MNFLLHNAFVYTGDSRHTCFVDGAIHVMDGRVRWIGSKGDWTSMPGVEQMDLGGRVVMPGLINTHGHGGLSLHRGCCDSGDLFEWAKELAPNTSTLTLEDNLWGCHVAVMEMVRNGITTACDCTRYGAGLFSQVASTIGMRSLSGALANSPELRPAGRPNWPLALEETTQAMADRGDDPRCRFYLGAHSPYSGTPDLMVEVKRAATELGLPFVIHAAESRKEVEMVQERHGSRPIELLHRLGLLDRNSLLAHAVWMNDDEIAMVAESGAAVSHNPTSNAKLASGVAPIPALRRAGVPVGLGTDSMLSNNAQDLFQEMRMAVLMQRAHSLDGHSMVTQDALAMATLEGARTLGWHNEIGSLEAGKEADLVVLDLWHPLGLTAERVLSDLVFRAGPQHVHSVMVHGNAIYRDRSFVNVDEAAVRAEIEGHGALHLARHFSKIF